MNSVYASTACVAGGSDVFRVLDAYAQSKGVRIAVENHGMPEKDPIQGNSQTYLLCEAWEFESLWEAVPSPNAGMLLDLGHLKLAAQSLGFDREDFVDRVKENALSVHIHDNQGRADEHAEVAQDSRCLDVLRRYDLTGARVGTESRALSIDRIAAQVYLLQEALTGSAKEPGPSDGRTGGISHILSTPAINGDQRVEACRRFPVQDLGAFPT